jgi:predicted nucleic-acid-binding protein
MKTTVNNSARKRCEIQMRGMETERLKELVSMLEHGDSTERQALGIAIEILRQRGVKIEKLQLGVDNVYADPATLD